MLMTIDAPENGKHISRIVIAKAVAAKIEHAYPKTPEGKLCFAIFNQALMDFVSGNSSESARLSAKRYIESDMVHALLADVDPAWIQRVLKHSQLL